MDKLVFPFATESQWTASLKYYKEWKFHQLLTYKNNIQFASIHPKR